MATKMEIQKITEKAAFEWRSFRECMEHLGTWYLVNPDHWGDGAKLCHMRYSGLRDCLEILTGKPGHMITDEMDAAYVAYQEAKKAV